MEDALGVDGSLLCCRSLPLTQSGVVGDLGGGVGAVPRNCDTAFSAGLSTVSCIRGVTA